MLAQLNSNSRFQWQCQRQREDNGVEGERLGKGGRGRMGGLVGAHFPNGKISWQGEKAIPLVRWGCSDSRVNRGSQSTTLTDRPWDLPLIGKIIYWGEFKIFSLFLPRKVLWSWATTHDHSQNLWLPQRVMDSSVTLNYMRPLRRPTAAFGTRVLTSRSIKGWGKDLKSTERGFSYQTANNSTSHFLVFVYVPCTNFGVTLHLQVLGSQFYRY